MKPVHPDEMAARQEQQAAAMAAEAPVGGGRQPKSSADAFNEAQYKAFEDNMVPCDNCGRTFFPDRLVVHKRSCHAGASGRGSKPVRRGYTGATPSARDPSPGPSPRSAAASARVPAAPPPRAAAPEAPPPAAAAPASHPKFCQECGFRFTNPVKFCQECGTRV
eukprot:TRINITY_DN13872_c0_g1_i1.p1 TRINITY_DN13872_c0_g1~~TRINITY_DN13872_c0_g1_i1.p1  ORF type:complete len:164 (+),score=40.51 TRINITY_DN13872_c0_g1_i1:342-833(+)